MASEERFGYEWKKYNELDPRYEAQFLNWTATKPEDWKGKRVLDAGCGMGRNSYWPLSYGAARVVAFDNDEQSLGSARQTLAAFPNATVERHDLNTLPYKNDFDIVMCIGVLHHVRQPARVLANLVRALAPGGRVIVWVYSYEGNEWIVRSVNPIRTHITSRLPLPMVHLLAYFCSVPLWLYLRLTGGTSPYLRELRAYTFRHMHSIVFDQLIPTVANYWKQSEVEALAEPLGLASYSVERPKNNMGWILSGVAAP